MSVLELCVDAMKPGTLSREDVDDAQLLQQYVRAGDAEAIDLLFRRYADSAFRVAMRCCGNSADAEDAVQTAFLEVLRHAAQYQSKFSFRGWMMSIVINACRKKIRAEASLRQREQTSSAEPRIAT